MRNPRREVASAKEELKLPDVVVHGHAADFAQEILVGPHRIMADEPASAGGTDRGPTPYELLLAALGSCTSMTLGMYARRKRWPLEEVVVNLRHSRTHVSDCVDCDVKAAMMDRIDREIRLVGPLTSEQQSRLIEIANKCPVHRTLTSMVDIKTRLM
jgi:putative redox protein